MNEKNKKRIIIFIIALLVILVTIFFLTNNKKKQVGNISDAKEVDNIENFGYVLYDNKSSYYKSTFDELKKLLTGEEKDEKKYAELISKLFVIDFYSLNDKVSNTDIGGIDFIYEDARKSFINHATKTIYNYVESNVYGDRKQELPTVKEVTIQNTKTVNYQGEKTSDPLAYEIVVDISYEKDLKYPTNVKITLVHKNDKLYIVDIK